MNENKPTTAKDFEEKNFSSGSVDMCIKLWGNMICPTSIEIAEI